MPNQTVLGFDFGMKRIGVAAKQGDPNWEEVEKIIHHWKPMALIVGRPLKMDGSTQQITHAAEHFANELKSRYGLPVHQVDERLSSVEARSTVFEKGGYRALRKNPVDGVAAQIILQDWLEQQDH
jgi:putative Holliday junction resolvase